ncbi:DUF664 domain-containing protein [Brevibacterium luteolum]|uniref:mycothiol transferase n=1 Tax=Brevibacterium luteolum TaxID=199591 RepID=UPI00349F623C
MEPTSATTPTPEPTTPVYEPPNSGTELEVLTGFIDFSRSVLLRKTEGLTEAQLRTALAPSTMTLAGILTHMAFVEDYWFGHRVAGRPPAAPWDTAPWEDRSDRGLGPRSRHPHRRGAGPVRGDRRPFA